MSAQTNVLLFGHDPQLTETRTLILRGAGFQVHSASTVAGFETEGERALPDVIVLCHTLTLADCALALEIALARWPTAKMLVLTSGSDGIPDCSGAAAMEAADGPEKLVGRISHLAKAKDLGRGTAT